MRSSSSMSLFRKQSTPTVLDRMRVIVAFLHQDMEELLRIYNNLSSLTHPDSVSHVSSRAEYDALCGGRFTIHSKNARIHVVLSRLECYLLLVNQELAQIQCIHPYFKVLAESRWDCSEAKSETIGYHRCASIITYRQCKSMLLRDYI